MAGPKHTRRPVAVCRLTLHWSAQPSKFPVGRPHAQKRAPNRRGRQASRIVLIHHNFATPCVEHGKELHCAVSRSRHTLRSAGPERRQSSSTVLCPRVTTGVSQNTIEAKDFHRSLQEHHIERRPYRKTKRSSAVQVQRKDELRCSGLTQPDSTAPARGFVSASPKGRFGVVECPNLSSAASVAMTALSAPRWVGKESAWQVVQLPSVAGWSHTQQV